MKKQYQIKIDIELLEKFKAISRYPLQRPKTARKESTSAGRHFQNYAKAAINPHETAIDFVCDTFKISPMQATTERMYEIDFGTKLIESLKND